MPICTVQEKRRKEELDYRRKWLHQLQAEFKLVCSWYGVDLTTPAFRIIDSTTALGSWHPETRTISISSLLINRYSWDAVTNILKHEMAHQYVHEYLGKGAEQPHGASFQEACKKLGVMYPFSLATGNTPKVFSEAESAKDPEYERKISRVRKMLALAGSSNRHEAAAAMSKANSCIRKYNLERLGSGTIERYSYEIINTGKKRLHVIERRIARLLMDYFYVDIIYSELFDGECLESFKTIEVLGTQENVAIARQVYEFLRHRLETLWHNYRKAARAPGRLRKTYILGLLQGFQEKLEQDEQKNDSSPFMPGGRGSCQTMSALIVAQDQGLAEFTRLRFPRLRKVQYRASSIYCRDTYSAGKAEGKKITIYKGMEHKDGNRGRLIGNSA